MKGQPTFSQLFGYIAGLTAVFMLIRYLITGRVSP